MQNIYSELSEDDFLAFTELESKFRREYEEDLDLQITSWFAASSKYMNRTVAAAQALDIEFLSSTDVPPFDENEFREQFWAFQSKVENIIVQIQIKKSRNFKQNTVGLSDEQRTKIHALIEKIRQAVSESSASVEKKERLFKTLSLLSNEVSQPRTPLARFSDVAAQVAGVSKMFAEEGLEPYWKWVKALFGVLDDAQHNDLQLPKPTEVKKIEPPRKQIEKSEGTKD